MQAVNVLRHAGMKRLNLHDGICAVLCCAVSESVYIYNPKVNIGWKPVKAIIQRKYAYAKTNTTAYRHSIQSIFTYIPIP